MIPFQPARIAVLRHGYYPNDPRVFKEVRALTEAGYQVDVFCLRGDREASFESRDGVRVFRAPIRHARLSQAHYLLEYGLSFLWMSFQLTCRHLARWYTVIQVNTLPDALVFATLIPKCLGARVLLDLHEPTPELYVTKYPDKPDSLLQRLNYFIERWAIRYADTALTVNDTIRKRFIERGAPPERMLVVRNVPDDQQDAPLPQRPAPDGFFRLVTHGTIQPRYGHELLLRALPRLRQHIPHLRLDIIGDGETLDEIKQLARDLHCDDLVSFTGQVPLSMVPQYLIRADIGIVPLQPSPFSELCQPNKLFEYIALGIPVVVSRLPAIEETFDESCVQFFAPGNADDLADAILTLYEHPGLRQRLAHNAARAYQSVRWTENRKTYLAGVQSSR